MEKIDYHKLVLRSLFLDGPSTRTKIAEKHGIRKNTIGVVFREMLKAGEIFEVEPNVRRNSKFSLDPSRFISIGIEHKTDCLRIVMLGADSRTVFSRTVDMGDVFDEGRVDNIVKHITDSIAMSGKDRDCIVGIGFGDVIPHDIGTGLKTRSIWMPGWGSINIKAIVEGQLGFPIIVMRCTDAFCFAEHKFGAFKDTDVFMCVELDNGIGLSVFRDHGHLKGSTDIFGELGHTVFLEDGEICKCGNRGCLETVAGIGAIIRKVKENIDKGVYFKTQKGGAAGDEITIDDVILNAREGNKLALLSLNEAVKAVGDMLAIVVNVLGITDIVLYGDLIKAGELLSRNVLDSIRKHCIYPLNHDPRIVLSELDDYASARGAAYAVMRKFFVE